MDGFPDFTSAKVTAANKAPLERLIECASIDPVGPAQITPRQWAYGRFLLFGTASVIGAVDGGGKGAIAVVMILAMVTGRPLLGEQVWRTGPVAIISYEDDETEWHRRIAAACIHYDLEYEAVLPNIHFIRSPSSRVTFAASADGFVTFPDSSAIIKILIEKQAVMLLIDPFNHAHNLDDGNNNALIAQVAGEMSRIARESGAAVLVLHHLRKGSAGNPDDLMGATSLRATFRSCRILARMTPEIADKMNVAEPWRYIRTAGSKENYAPPPEKSSWFKLVSVPLGNVTDEYPDGDDIAVVTTWQPRPMFEGMDGAALKAVFAALRVTVHSPNKQAKSIPWAAKPLIEIGGRSELEAKKILAGWIDNGVLIKGFTTDPKNSNKIECVTVVDAKIAQILAEL